MSTLTESESPEHEALVRMMAEYFRSKNYRGLKADLAGWPTPDEISGCIPDVTGIRPDTNVFVILEAETCDSIIDSHTEEQWKAFYEYVSHGAREFHVAVPRQCGSERGRDVANRRARKLGITFHTVWSPPEA